MALLDDLGKFIQTPAGIGLLSAVAGGAMGARRGTPWNNMGRAATAGLLGYSGAQDNQFTAELKKMQMDEARSKALDRDNMQEAQRRSVRLASPEGGVLDPEQYRANMFANTAQMGLDPSGYMPKVGEPYTLGKGQQRRDANNLLVAEGPNDSSDVFGNVSPGDFTPASLEKFKTSGNYGDLVRQYAPTSGSGGNPYFNFIGTPAGIAVGDARTGNLRLGNIEGQPVVKSADDPRLQGNIAAAKGEGTKLGEQAANVGVQEGALTAVGSALNLLDKGIYSGGYADIKRIGAKYVPGINTDKASRTEQFLSHVGNTVVPRLVEFGGNDSNEELKYLQGIMAGNIRLEGDTLRGVLKSSEAKINRGIARVKNRESVYGGVVPQAFQPGDPARSVFDEADAILGSP